MSQPRRPGPGAPGRFFAQTCHIPQSKNPWKNNQQRLLHRAQTYIRHLLFETAASIQTSLNDISTPTLSPHLSKTRQRTVLARIQPQLLFIPSYSSRTELRPLLRFRRRTFQFRVMFIRKDKLERTLSLTLRTARVATSTKRVHQSAVPHRTTGHRPARQAQLNNLLFIPAASVPVKLSPLFCAPVNSL